MACAVQAHAKNAEAGVAQARGKSKRMWNDLMDMASPAGTSVQLRRGGAPGTAAAGADSGGDADYERACLASMQVCASTATGADLVPHVDSIRACMFCGCGMSSLPLGTQCGLT